MLGDKDPGGLGLMGLHVPASTPNLRTVQAMSAAGTAAVTLCVYNVSEHVDDENTNDEIDEKVTGGVSDDPLVRLVTPSEETEMRHRCRHTLILLITIFH